jgi:2-dehydro-3-deoxyphosphogluconate aldolase / (4S)-4-hydroxy-2-oxoglutarate aldolase
MPRLNEAIPNLGTFGSQLASLRVVPVVVLDSPADAAPLANALAGGGIGCMEITFRTAAAAEAIASVASRDDVLVGAGTVTSAAQALTAIDAGARFVVSPGFADDVAGVCRERSVPCLELTRFGGHAGGEGHHAASPVATAWAS